MVASGGLGFLVVLPSSHFSDLINGSRKGFFVASRGLRQGDPLSPFLFTLVAEALTQILSTREEKNLFKWFRVGKEEILISHLQYAGYTLLLMEGDKNQVPNSLIHCFELVSGMKINWKKELFSWLKFAFRRIFGDLRCPKSPYSFEYLGVPLGGLPRKRDFWLPVIERVKES